MGFPEERVTDLTSHRSALVLVSYEVTWSAITSSGMSYGDYGTTKMYDQGPATNLLKSRLNHQGSVMTFGT